LRQCGVAHAKDQPDETHEIFNLIIEAENASGVPMPPFDIEVLVEILFFGRFDSLAK
jgi:hypothetical protein